MVDVLLSNILSCPSRPLHLQLIFPLAFSSIKANIYKKREEWNKNAWYKIRKYVEKSFYFAGHSASSAFNFVLLPRSQDPGISQRLLVPSLRLSLVATGANEIQAKSPGNFPLRWVFPAFFASPFPAFPMPSLLCFVLNLCARWLAIFPHRTANVLLAC